jgi:hypothetical protein
MEKSARIIPFRAPAADAPTFEAVNIRLAPTGAQWLAAGWFSYVQIAHLLVGKDEAGVAAFVDALEPDAPENLLDSLTKTQDHIDGLAKLCGVAIARLQFVLNAKAAS